MNLRGLLRSIRVRLTLWYVLLLTIVLTAFSGVLYLALRVTLYDDWDDVLRSGATLATDALEVDVQGRLVSGQGQSPLWSDPHQGENFWRVLDPSGQTIAQSGVQDINALPISPAVLAKVLSGREVFQTSRAGGDPIRVFTAPVVHERQIIGVVQIGISLDELNETLAAFRWLLVVFLPLTLAMASVGGVFLAGRALYPVDRITRTAQSINASDLSQRLDMDLPDDELGRLARTLDAMIARLDAAFRRQRRFTADASHELRTPLTVIKGDLSVALGRPRDAEYYRGVLTDVDQEVDQMTHLVDRLLALARADSDGIELHRQTVDLEVLLKDVTEQVRPLAEAKGLDLVTRIEPNLTVSLDPDAVTQISVNLLENAIKYTSSRRIRLSAHRASGTTAQPGRNNAGELQIAVSDSGPGISEEHLPRIFDRFYRVDRARSRELGGAGLGLSIARELARAHGGDVTVDSIPGEGSTFIIHLPTG